MSSHRIILLSAGLPVVFSSFHWTCKIWCLWPVLLVQLNLKVPDLVAFAVPFFANGRNMKCVCYTTLQVVSVGVPVLFAKNELKKCGYEATLREINDWRVWPIVE